MDKLLISFYGFFSGYIYCFLSITLQATFTKLGYPISFISSLALTLIPYSFKFLWSSFVDNINESRYENYLFLFILLVSLSFIIIFYFNEFQSILFLIFLFNLAFLGSCFDLLADANLIKNFKNNERSTFLSFYIFGWRLASIITGGVLLFIFEKLFKNNLNYLFLISFILFFLIDFLIILLKKINFLNFILKNKIYIFLIIPPFSFLFILKISYSNFKTYLPVLYSLKDLYFYSLFYKLFDLITAAFVINFFITNFNLNLEFFGIINTVIALISIISCGYLWQKIINNYDIKSAMFFSLILKSITLIFFIFIIFLKLSNIVFFIITFFLNVISSNFITYSFSNFLMQSTKENNSTFKYSILSSLPTLLLFVFLPISSFIINNYSWFFFFIFIMFLQFFSYYSIKQLRVI